MSRRKTDEHEVEADADAVPGADDGPWDAAATESIGGRDHAMVRQVRLRVLSGPEAGEVFTSRGERTVIGTHSRADVRSTDPTLSRFHCEITLSGGKAIVRDLESRNGTRVDGVVVLAAELHDGAVLGLGRSQIRFEHTTEAVRVPLSESERFGGLVGRSVGTRAAFAILERAAPTDATVLLTGETGTGKDVAAESIHRESPRRDGPFVVIDCGAIPAGLLESELFGHLRGSFTGADRDRVGAFELASGGTLFLDEIGELPLELQPKLLRALESRSIRPIGAPAPSDVDVRILAATNRDLRAEVNARRFRSDLFFRLAVIEVTLPPLRQRTEDVPLLVEALLESMGASRAPMAAELRSGRWAEALLRHPWPGNVRELRNTLERVVALQEMPALDAPLPAAAASLDALVDPRQPLRLARERWVRTFERRYLEALLRQHGDNVSAAARAAGVDRIHLHRLLSRTGLR